MRGRLEAEGSSGAEVRMEERKQFLCGVVEGKADFITDLLSDRVIFFPYLEGMVLNSQPFDLDFSVVCSLL